MNYDLSDWVSNLLFTCKYNYVPGSQNGVIEEEKDYVGDFGDLKNSFGNFTELHDPRTYEESHNTNNKMEIYGNNSQLSENQNHNYNNQQNFPETDLEIENLD